MEHWEPLKEAVLWSEILQIYVFTHTHFTWRNYANLLLQMIFEHLGNNYSPFAFAIDKRTSYIMLFSNWFLRVGSIFLLGSAENLRVIVCNFFNSQDLISSGKKKLNAISSVIFFFFYLVWSPNQHRNEIYVAHIFFSKQPNGTQV